MAKVEKVIRITAKDLYFYKKAVKLLEQTWCAMPFNLDHLDWEYNYTPDEMSKCAADAAVCIDYFKKKG